jgi:hypothetical protein
MASWISAVGSFLRVIFAHESLPAAPASPPETTRRGVLALLFSPEPLPEDPPAAERPRGRWLAWLFAAERLDDQQPR